MKILATLVLINAAFGVYHKDKYDPVEFLRKFNENDQRLLHNLFSSHFIGGKPTLHGRASDDEPTTATDFMPCGDGDEKYFRGNCYYFQQLPSLSWQDADQFCDRHNSSLVTITSHEENLWLMRKNVDIFGDWTSHWIGMRRVFNPQTTQIEPVWADGSKIDFYNFWQNAQQCPNPQLQQLYAQSQQPIRRPFCNGLEECTVLYNKPDEGIGFWTDANCEERRAFVCKRAANHVLDVVRKSTLLDEIDRQIGNEISSRFTPAFQQNSERLASALNTVAELTKMVETNSAAIDVIRNTKEETILDLRSNGEQLLNAYDDVVHRLQSLEAFKKRLEDFKKLNEERRQRVPIRRRREKRIILDPEIQELINSF